MIYSEGFIQKYKNYCYFVNIVNLITINLKLYCFQ